MNKSPNEILFTIIKEIPMDMPLLVFDKTKLMDFLPKEGLMGKRFLAFHNTYINDMYNLAKHLSELFKDVMPENEMLMVIIHGKSLIIYRLQTQESDKKALVVTRSFYEMKNIGDNTNPESILWHLLKSSV